MDRASEATSNKREMILQAARELFLEHGFASTSVDAVTSLAGVSKPTVYSYFPTKEALLEGVVERESALAPAPLAFPVTGKVQHDLETVARTLMTMALAPDTLAWDRMMAGESRRRPELGRLFFDHGPRRIIKLLTQFLTDLGRSDLLHIPHPESAADFFFGMVIGFPLLRAQLTGEVDSEAEVLERCKEFSQRFLHAYSPLSKSKKR